MADKLDDGAIAQALAERDGWTRVSDRAAISKTFEFQDFSEAFAFMTRCAMAAEQLNHHPEWFNVYRRVDVTLSTHDAGGVTDLDLKLADAMDRFAAAR